MQRYLARMPLGWPAPRRTAKSEAGATAIEYSMMICMVALGILALVAVMGGVASDWFSNMATAL